VRTKRATDPRAGVESIAGAVQFLAGPDLTASGELHAPTPATSMTADDDIQL
jgi:hypothetical protein